MSAIAERDDASQRVFAALADPTRRQLLERLAAGERATIGDLAAGLPISRQAVSKHLAALHDAGLIDMQPVGRERIVTLTPRPLHDASAWIGAVEARWDQRLARLASYLDTPAEAD